MASSQNRTILRHFHTLFSVGAVAGLTDGQLLERFLARRAESSESAFAALVERHGPMVIRVCRAVLRDEHEAQDAFQVTFLVLVRKARTLWVRDSLGPWLHGVACRVASCARSAAARRREHERRAAKTWVDTGSDECDELRSLIHEEIQRLPARYREAVVLCCLQGLTHAQAARQLGWPVGTVESRLARGRARLRSGLGRRGVSVPVSSLAIWLSRDATEAAVPVTLVDATVGAAAGPVVAAGTVSGAIASLTQEVLRAMVMTKLKLGAVSVLTAGLVLAGAGVLAQQGGAHSSRGAATGGAASDSSQPQGGSGPAAEQAQGPERARPEALREAEELVARLSGFEVAVQNEVRESEARLRKNHKDLLSAKERLKALRAELGQPTREAQTESEGRPRTGIDADPNREGDRVHPGEPGARAATLPQPNPDDRSKPTWSSDQERRLINTQRQVQLLLAERERAWSRLPRPYPRDFPLDEEDLRKAAIWDRLALDGLVGRVELPEISPDQLITTLFRRYLVRRPSQGELAKLLSMFGPGAEQVKLAPEVIVRRLLDSQEFRVSPLETAIPSVPESKSGAPR